MKIAKNISELIGQTPMLCMSTVRNDWEIYLKIEGSNPAGSFKDRTAKFLIEAAETAGKLKPGMRLYESSSGNTAKALAMLCAAKGYKFTAIVDKHAPADKLNAIRAYGGDLHFCTDEEDPKGGHLVDVRRAMAKKLAEENGGLNLDQYDNPNNPLGFYHTLGKEIFEQVEGIDYLLGTIGTGSSLSGVARYLKEYGETSVFALEPKGSAHYTPRGHGYFISGPGYPVGAVLPKNIDRSVIDKHDFVSDSEAFNTLRFFARQKGLLVGDSSGMLLYYAMKYIQDQPVSNKVNKMVLIVGDKGESYLSHAFNETWMIEKELLDAQIEKDLAAFYV